MWLSVHQNYFERHNEMPHIQIVYAGRMNLVLTLLALSQNLHNLLTTPDGIAA